MVSLPVWLRDWWRGYSDADVVSSHEKLSANQRPDAVIPVTKAELLALIAES